MERFDDYDGNSNVNMSGWLLCNSQWRDDQCIDDDFTPCREQVWPELDQLLHDEYEQPSSATPYTAAIPQYRVEIHDPSVPLYEETNTKKNGQAIYDIHHPC